MRYLRSYFHYRHLMFVHSLAHHRRERLRFIGFAAFFVFVAVLLYLLLYKAFVFFNSFEIVGEFVIMKLLSTIFFFFFVFLIISNINSIIKWFFSKEDMSMLLTSPVSPGDIFFSRGIDALIESSWAFLVLSLPVLLAYYTALGKLTFMFFPIYMLLIPFVLIPFGVAFILVVVLGRVVSPKIIKNAFSFLSLVMIALLVIALRALQIEKMVRPESFAQLYEYMRFLAVPTHPLIPVHPFIEAVVFSIKGGTGAILFDIGFFVSTAAGLITIAYWLHTFFFARCYSNMRASSMTVKRNILGRVFSFLPMKTKQFVLKEIRNIQRDPKEWSQVFLLLALVVVYVYNFKIFPRDRSPLPTIVLESILSFLNMGLLTFVISAISVRFVYPSFQIEGRPFWLPLTAPVTMNEIYRRKLGIYMPPILVLAFLLNYLSNMYISTPPLLYYISFGYIVLVALLAPILSMYLGTKQIKFREVVNPYGGMGGIMAMLVIMFYAGVTLGLIGWASFWMLFFIQRNIPPPVAVQIRFAAACFLIVAGTFFLVRHCIVKTSENLRKIEL